MDLRAFVRSRAVEGVDDGAVIAEADGTEFE